MKKILLVLVAIITTTMAFAQDVIVTTDAQKIKAKVLEVSSTEVKYVNYDDQNGPVFVLTSDEVSSILFAHGDVKIFERDIEKSVVVNNTPYIYRNGNRYTYDGVTMKGAVYADFLSKNCTAAYDKYKHGHNIATAGWVLLGVGLGLDLGFSWWLPYSGYIGLVCEIACIPTLIVGYTQMHRSAEIFNTSCGRNSLTSLSVTASDNGIGLALNF